MNFKKMKPKCTHNMEFTKIDHWWFRFECKQCKKRFRWLPKGDYYTWELE